MPQHIVVTDYNPEWPKEYGAEKEAIEMILRDNQIAIYHIGSTAVPGLAAKPVIDIMAVVKSLEEADQAAEEFAEIGYEWLGEYGIPGRRYLRKGGDERTHQIHIFQADDWKNIERHLAFRDYMRSHKKEREEYEKLKKTLAIQFPYDIDGYCRGKEEFIRAVEKQALGQYDGIWDELYIAARKAQYEKRFSPWLEAGAVGAALLTESGHIYVGVSIDTVCSLGMCAERNAIANMITNRENKIVKLAAVLPDGKAVMPCGACRELMMQLSLDSGDAEILQNYETKQTIRLKDLIPYWWAE